MNTIASFLFLDDKVGIIDDKKASEWIKETSLFVPLTDESYALKLLPVNGDIMNIESDENPNMIYPFFVEREGAASILPETVSLSIINASGHLVYEGQIIIDIDGDYSSYAGLDIKKLGLEKGVYVVEGTVVINGEKVTDSIKIEQ